MAQVGLDIPSISIKSKRTSPYVLWQEKVGPRATAMISMKSLGAEWLVIMCISAQCNDLDAIIADDFAGGDHTLYDFLLTLVSLFVSQIVTA